MRSKVTAVFVFCSLFLCAQITKEHTYPYASMLIAYQTPPQLLMVNLEVDGQKYLHIHRGGKQLIFYNLDHSPFKTISYAAATDLNPNYDAQDILYISQKLFDTDNDIEFMYVDQFITGAGAAVITQIVNEDGTIMWTENSAAPIVKVNVPQAQVPIYNTPQGTKMILSMVNGDANVYSLTGTLTAMVLKNNETTASESVLFPNPARKSVQISNSPLPFNQVQLFSLDGKLVHTINVNETFEQEVDISSLSEGTYLLQTLDKNGQVIENKKIIKN